MSDVLTGKAILIVDDEPDVLETLKELLDMCVIDCAHDFNTAEQFLKIKSYDAVILDIMGVNGYDLIELTEKRATPALMLTAHALSTDALKKSIEMGARAYIPKEKMIDIAAFLEDVMTLEHGSNLKRMFQRLGGFFNKKFGSQWMENEQTFWTQVTSGNYEPKPVILKK